MPSSLSLSQIRLKPYLMTNCEITDSQSVTGCYSSLDY